MAAATAAATARRRVAPLALSSLLSGSLVVGASLPARADDSEAHQEAITGLEREGREDDQDAERALDAITWLPRQLIYSMVRAQALLARFAHDQQLVPRYEHLLSGSRPARVYVYPTLFAETQSPFSVGARALADYGPWAVNTRLGFGGLGDWAAEGALQYAVNVERVPLVVLVEGFVENASDLEYYGVGHEPLADPRNSFAATPYERGRYRQERRRLIGSLGIRPSPDLQLLSSSSLDHRRIEDAEDAADEALSAVFHDVPSWGPSSWIAYHELALRHDSRPQLGGDVPGVLSEVYSGYGHDVIGARIGFSRVGGRLAGFFPIHRPTNILSPRIVIDGIAATDGDPIPFTELARQPTYRGADRHRDRVSIVASLDYSWRLASFMAARLFVDAASVGPTVDDAVTELPRFAGGFGLDFFTSTIGIARIRAGGSNDGFHAHLSVGEPNVWGERQRRD